MTNKFRFNEDTLLDEIKEYILSTYEKHYVGEDDFQTVDAWNIIGIAEEVCIGTAIKYPMRYKKKGDANDARNDLFKAIHYLVLTMHFGDKKMELENDDSFGKSFDVVSSN